VGCEKCGNRIGFVFGTCCNCGWNYLDKTWHYIKVNVNDLPMDLRYYLIDKHESKYEKSK
jgi:hypothetical protein